jgi:hypothetical protein
MERAKSEAIEPSKASSKKIQRLAELLNEIQARQDPVPDLLRRFQSQYQEVPREERPWFFDAILRCMETQKDGIEGHLRVLLAVEDGDPIEWSRLLTQLRRKMESPRMRAFRRFLNISGGFKFLLDMRADVLTAQRVASLELEPLDEEISYLFNSWFQHGFLFLQEITRDSSFRQIRFLKEHDMVHPMASLEEMGNRLGEDRRCFALYHRAMPEEPVVFIEAALTRGMARSIHEIIGEEPEPTPSKAAPDTAIFYSINNTQDGLAGLGLGKVLIFQVLDAVKKDNPGIKTYSTLSPITGFWPRYLEPILRGKDETFVMKRERLLGFFPAKAQHALMEHRTRVTGGGARDFGSVLFEILGDPKWIADRACTQWLQTPLAEIAYFYITKERNRQGRPLNPVAGFHMGNGARVSLKNVNFGANISERGLKDSCGLMVNYVYSSTWLQQIGRTMQSRFRGVPESPA